jgi:hypothetical protein
MYDSVTCLVKQLLLLWDLQFHHHIHKGLPYVPSNYTDEFSSCYQIPFSVGHFIAVYPVICDMGLLINLFI